MKIPVRVEFDSGGLRPMVTVVLQSKEPKIFGFIRAIIDTGSPSTILGASDVQKMRISQVQMRKFTGAEVEVNLGGAQIKTRVLENAELIISNKK